jgi:transposase
VSAPVFVRVDVSSRTLEVAGSTEAKTAEVRNDAAGIAQLVARSGGLMPARVVLEAAGGDAFAAACALQATGPAVAVVDPRRARDVARAMGRWPGQARSMRGCWRRSPACCTGIPGANASSSRWPTPRCSACRRWCCAGANACR